MRRGRWWLAAVVGAISVLFGASLAFAAELEDGDYTLSLPGIGEFEFTIDSEGSEERVIAVAAPEGYVEDDDDPDKASWKDEASLEVEVKHDKVEGNHDWSEGPAVLTLGDGGTITIHEPDGDGNFTVDAGNGYHAFGEGGDWYVANNEDISAATKFFKVEATADGVEIKAVDSPDDGFLNDLEEEEEEAEAEEEGEGQGRGRGNNPNN